MVCLIIITLYALWYSGENITIYHWVIALLLLILSPLSFIVLLLMLLVIGVLYTFNKLEKVVCIKGRKK